MEDKCDSVSEVEKHPNSSVKVSKSEKHEAKYEKLGNAGIEGTSFQVDLLTVFLLNAVERSEDWRLSTENKQGGKFDDVVFESPRGDVLLQAKHKQNERKITLEDLLSTNSKQSDFSLPHYFFSYQDIKNKFNIQNVIICTNAKIQIKEHMSNLVVAQNLNAEHLLHLPGVATISYTFNGSIKSELKMSLEKYLQKNLQDKNIPAEVISDENIDDYLKRLQLVASYPCGKDMEKIMGNIISNLKWSRNLDGDTCLKFIRKKIEDWYKEKRGRYLTRVNSEAYFCEIRGKYLYGLNRYGVYFENISWPLSFKLLHIIPRQTYILNLIKVLQAFESASLTEMLFLNVAKPSIFEKLVVEAFKIPQYTHLLILSSRNRQIDIMEEICDKILEILNSCPYKKVILIGREDDKIAKKIKSIHFNFYHAVFDNVVFTDFTEETREKFRQKVIIVFQGMKLCLNELCVTDDQLNHLLHPEFLEKLAKDERIKIGSKLLEEDIEHLYIPRSFTQNDYVFAEQDMCELDNTLPKVILIPDFAGMGKSVVLTKLSVILKKKYPHLWVIRIDLNIYTKYLRNCINNLATINILDLLNSVRATKIINSFETELFSLDGRIVLMLDGVDEISPDYTEVVFQLLTDCNANLCFKRIFVTTRPHLRQSVEDILKVDSFSLEPFSTKNQIDFIKRWLETQLNVQDEIKMAKCKVYAECLVAKVAVWLDEGKDTFAGIPLQTRMLAEVFQERTLSSEDDLEDWEGFKEFLTSSEDVPKFPRKINLVRLYQMFVDRKRDIFIYEKGSTNGNLLAEEGVKKIYNECQEYHYALALQVILDEDESKVFHVRVDKYENDPEQNALKIGIVQKINKNIQFIHRTFAEYFVAKAVLLELKRKSQDSSFQEFFIRELLQRYEFNLVRTFLDSMIKNELCSLPRETFESMKFVCEKSTKNFLHVVARDGCLYILRFLIECLKYTDFKNPFYRLYAKLTAKPIDLNLRNNDNKTPLHIAARNGYSSVVQLLLEQGASADVVDNFKFKPIHYAAQEGHLKVVEVLTEHEEGVDSTAVNKAAENGHLHVVRYLVEKEANVKDIVKFPLYFAALRGRLNVIKYLLEKRVDVNEVPDWNLLSTAALNGHLDLVRYLIEKGVEVKDLSAASTCHPLDFAAHNGHLHVVRYLIDKEINVEDSSEYCLPNVAAFTSHLNSLKYLIETGVNAKDAPMGHPLNLAALDGHLNIVKYLIEQGVNVNETSWCYPLNVAALNGHLNVVRYLMEKGVNIDDNPDCNPLDFAAFNGHLNVVTYLIEKGVKVKEAPGFYPQDFAASNGYWNIIGLLLEEGINVNEDPRCRALDFAASNGHLNVITYLIEKGVNVQQASICHPLNFAAFNGRTDVVKFLLDYGVDVNALNSSKYTALHYAVAGGHLNTVELLKERGSDVNIADNGETALQLATRKGALDVARVLIENGASPL